MTRAEPPRPPDAPRPTYTRRQRALAVAGVLLATMIFGGAFASGRHGALAGLNPADLVTLRYIAAGLVFAPWMLREALRGGRAGAARIGWGRGVVLAFFGAAGNALVVMIGVNLSPANHGAVLNPGMTPIYGVALGVWLLAERPPAGAVVGIPLALAGLVLVGGESFRVTGMATWPGDVVLALSGSLWALFTVLVRKWRIAPWPATATINALSALAWIPAYGLVTGFRPLLAAQPSELIGQALVLGVAHASLAVLLWARGIAVLGATRTLMFPALVPVWGTLLAWALLGEALTPLQWLGVGVVSVGMLVTAARPGLLWRKARAEDRT